MDLRHWNFEKDGIVALSGTWEFYWNQQIIMPGTKPAFINYPHYWNHQKDTSGVNYPGQGYALLRCRIILPENRQVLALEEHEVMSAFEIIANKDTVCRMGHPATDKLHEIPLTKKAVGFFTSTHDTCELILRVSNFNHRNGGFANALILGGPEQIIRMVNKRAYIDIFTICCLLVGFLIHVQQYVTRGKNLSTLIFGILCLIIALRTSVINSKILLDYIALPYTYYRAIEYITAFYMPTVFVHFAVLLLNIRPLESKIQATYAVSVILTLLYLCLPTELSSYLVNVLFSYILLIGALIIYHLIIKVRKKNRYALQILIAAGLLLLIITKDMLYINAYYSDSYHNELFFVALVLYHGIILSSKMKRTEAIERELRNDHYRILHNNLGASISGLGMMGKIARKRLEQGNDETSSILKNMEMKSRKVINDMEDTLWVLNENNNRDIGELLTRITTLGVRELTPLGIKLDINCQETVEYGLLNFEQRCDVFTVVKEAIENTIKHGNATCINMSIKRHGEYLILIIHDNGSGFDVKSPSLGNGFVLFEQIRQKLSAHLQIESKADSGCCITFKIPI